MLGMLSKIEETFAAAAFAEAGEVETAMQMADVKETGAGAVDSFAAAAFAEAGCPAEALEIMGRAPRKLAPPRQVCGFLESVGLAGVSVAYGLAEA